MNIFYFAFVKLYYLKATYSNFNKTSIKYMNIQDN